MKKNFRKISALVLALAMVLSMSAVAFAADPVPDKTGTLAANGVVKNADHSSVGTTLNIPKGVTVYGSLDKVYGPTVTYTYTIAPQAPAASAKVIDYNNIEAVVQQGPADSASLTDANAAFTSSEIALTSGSAEITDNITVSIDTTKFTKPGVYRYLITDTTTTETLFNAGITRADDYLKTRTLDVYVKYNSTETAFEVYGYVLMDENIEKVEGVDDQPLQWVTPGKKSSGYIASSETTKTDTYHTIDVQVTKKVTGAMGDKTHEFPFTIAISNNSLTYYSAELTAAPTAVASLTAGAETSKSATLKDADVFYIYGLNPKATVAYTENNNTPDVYTLTVTDKGGAGSYVNDNAATPAPLNAVQIGPLVGASKTTATLAVSNYDADNDTNSVAAAIAATNASAITFTNNLEEISPTGVALRVAPYVAILCGGIVLLVISRKRRAEEE